jgi:hypothetical protein
MCDFDTGVLQSSNINCFNASALLLERCSPKVRCDEVEQRSARLASPFADPLLSLSVDEVDTRYD